MSDEFQISSPLYEFPMSDTGLQLIGMITLLWGQVDRITDGLLMNLYGWNEQQFNMFAGGKTLTPKSEQLKAAATRCEKTGQAKLIEDMCAAIKDCTADRNLMTHGQWGWEWRQDEKLYYSCARSAVKKTFFYLKDLPDLYERVNKAAMAADAAQAAIFGFEPTENRNRALIFADEAPMVGQGPPPKFER